MREKLLKKLAAGHAVYPWRMLAVVLVLTLVFAYSAGHLTVTMRWSDLLPSKDPRTVEFNKIIDEFVSATSLVVVVQGEESRIKEFADTLAPKITAAYDDQHEIQLFRRVDYKQEIEFLKDHGLLLLKEENLKDLKTMFMDANLTGLLANLNDSMEKEYVGKQESISTREKEDQAVMFLDGLQSLVLSLQEAAEGDDLSETDIQAVADKLLLGESYYLSYDKTTLILNAIPNFTMMDLELVEVGTDAVQEIVDELLLDHSDVTVGLTGFIAIGRDEMYYSERSLGYTTAIALVAILALLILSFRMWVAPLLALTNLLVGILWAVGIVAVVVGQLNIMTQMMAVILLGLGIDFSIHLISGFTEWRAAGDNIAIALEKTFLKNGKGVITGALTTACAFFTLVISQSRGMKEMGLVTGAGLLAILVTTFLFLPSLLVLRERRLDKRQARSSAQEAKVQRDITFRFLGNTAVWMGKRYGFTVLAALFLTALFVWLGMGISFDHNYLNIEPKGITSVVMQDVILDKFDLSMDYALVLTDSIDQSREIAEEYRKIGSVAMAEDISMYLPSWEQQQTRTTHIQEIRDAIVSQTVRPQIMPEELPLLMTEIERLEMNVLEMQDMAFLGGQDKVDNKCQELVGDPEASESINIFRPLYKIFEESGGGPIAGFSFFQRSFSPYYRDLVLRMTKTDSLDPEDLPLSILDRFSNDKRDQFLISVFPAGGIWQDAEFLKRFVDDLERVSEKATGMPPVFRALIEVIGEDGRNAVMLTVVIVFFLLWLDFRHPGYALMALIPLCGGVLWMLGLMRLTGMQLTVMNVMGLPMIVGIGIDDGVHIVHRYIEEGRAGCARFSPVPERLSF